MFFSSVAAKLGMPFHSSVSMVKSAIVGLCKSLSAEYAPKIRFNCISPSLFESKMSQRLLRNEKVKEKLSQNNPLGRIGSPKDISSIIHFCSLKILHGLQAKILVLTEECLQLVNNLKSIYL